MSGIISIHDIKEKLKAMQFPVWMKAEFLARNISKARMSMNIGRDSSYLQRQIKNPDQRISIIWLLSLHLGRNLFEVYQNQLPENIRPTHQEKVLKQQIEDLQKQLADITKERDLLKEILMVKH